jgi:guanylate kinase
VVSEYDYAIVNEDLVAAVSQVAAILEAEARRVPRQRALPEFVEELRRDVIASAEKIGKKSRNTSH